MCIRDSLGAWPPDPSARGRFPIQLGASCMRGGRGGTRLAPEVRADAPLQVEPVAALEVTECTSEI
eukprot:1693567-Alexandrium_andersonii.AAC.1